MPTLILERRDPEDRTVRVGSLAVTPLVDEDYWSYRVRLTAEQSVVGFPKFGTVGIGFAQEEDWNTNLPYTCGAKEIRKHIWHNRGDESITKAAVDEAIGLIQAAARADRSDA